MTQVFFAVYDASTGVIVSVGCCPGRDFPLQTSGYEGDVAVIEVQSSVRISTHRVDLDGEIPQIVLIEE